MVNVSTLKAPFPWFGGKSRAASIIWQALGNVHNYVEPFFGSGAVLLGRPGGAGKIETVNDLDEWVANFWRAVTHDPEQVAHYADWPVLETDLHARHGWLLRQDEWRRKMRDVTNPDFYDARIAGWWVWGLCAWIGSGWCSPKRGGTSAQLPRQKAAGQGIHKRELCEQLPHLSKGPTGMDASRMSDDVAQSGTIALPSEQLPMLAHGARGMDATRMDADRPSEQLPHLNNSGRGGHRAQTVTTNIVAWMLALSNRMRRVRVASGEWERVLTPAVTTGHGLTGVVLDAPYNAGADLYGNHDKTTSTKAKEWAVANGDDPLLRIAFCGYEGEHEAFPDTWREVKWKAQGGYGSGNGNPHRERIWFSPHCLGGVASEPLFARLTEHTAAT